MRKMIAIVFFIFSVLSVIWVSSGLLAPSYSQKDIPTPTTLPPTLPQEESFPKLNQTDSFSYDPTGRRDPFRPYGIDFEKASIPGGVVNEILTDLQMVELKDFKIVAISWGSDKPSAILKDPKGKYHVVKPYTKIGKNNGFIAKIREGEIIVVEPSEVDGVSTVVTQVLSLKK